MQLSDLYPKITSDMFLVFDCPACKGDSHHRIRIPLHPATKDGRSWHHAGHLERLTVSPSVDAGCWHGTITNGEVSTCVS